MLQQLALLVFLILPVYQLEMRISMHNLVEHMKTKHKVTQNHNLSYAAFPTAAKRGGNTFLVSGTEVTEACHLGIFVLLCILEYTNLCI